MKIIKFQACFDIILIKEIIYKESIRLKITYKLKNSNLVGFSLFQPTQTVISELHFNIVSNEILSSFQQRGREATDDDYSCLVSLAHSTIRLWIRYTTLSRRMRWAGHVARMREKRNAYRLLVGKPERKRLLGRTRHGWVDNIRMDL
jgi:hypothetical protein